MPVGVTYAILCFEVKKIDPLVWLGTVWPGVAWVDLYVIANMDSTPFCLGHYPCGLGVFGLGPYGFGPHCLRPHGLERYW